MKEELFMKVNVGLNDKIIRIVISVLLAVGGYVFNVWALYVVAAMLMVTVFTGMCGLYALFGISTCPRKKTN